MSAEAMLLLEQVDSSISLKIYFKYTNKSGITNVAIKNLKIVCALFFPDFSVYFLKNFKMIQMALMLNSHQIHTHAP